MYAGRLEQRSVALDGSLFMIHAQSLALVRELFTVHEYRNVADVVMLKFVRIALQRNVKICILNHDEQQMFRDGTEDGFLYRQGI